MPTRRTMELILITIVLAQPAFGVVKLWASKTLGSYPAGNPLHTVASTTAIVLG